MKKESRKGTIRRCGLVWEASNSGYPDDWYTTVHERFHPMTWKFGSIHQSKVFVDYNHLVDGKTPASPKCDGDIGICLRYGKTTEEAMQICLDWIDKYRTAGPTTPEQVFQDSWDHWPTLYPMGDRISVIGHICFTLGGGYSWVDGAIICTSPEDWIESRRRDEEDESRKEMLASLKEAKALIKKYKLEEDEDYEDHDEFRERLHKQDVHMFYPVCEDYANICMVPDDVRPEWLALAYEAAILLRDKSGVPEIKSRWWTPQPDDYTRQEENRKIGTKVVADLERRFPQLKL